MILTIISDTHNKHNQITEDLPGGDLLLHAGDISSMGYEHEIFNFLIWMNKVKGYGDKIFIAGNHDWGFQDNPKMVQELLEIAPSVTYLQDELEVIGDDYQTAIKIWGSPWQPEFYNWAFNLPRNGEELKEKWGMIPMDTDILITHGPAWGYVDDVEGRRGEHLGCELLAERIKVVKPKIHICGHIHTGNGYMFDGDTHYINAAVLNERYHYAHKPFQVDWNPETNELVFL
jgi:Icc-related predicted phosphoesterase